MSNVILGKVSRSTSIRRKERDFLLLNIFVFVKYGYIDRARILADALFLMGDSSIDVLLARTVTRFLMRDWTATLAALEELDHADPIERFGSYQPTLQQRMRRYLKARSLYELDMHDSADDALESYLRHGTSGQETPE